ncbi:aminotransferase class V-fold PLP-dependent enzyme [Alicyclobacillus tolerans]|uniref:aminotransferase class V-fold PLP-dependent enzyme n=1 Tax=Alicyclobacillus tolerans TaxID=90970 RepID=UPI001F3D56F1|nr:aminotransferase class V-fold PLP-dependent enzyme [Alicyclobacillus tolerans]MCF8567465.1 aminotransferase class V-fold PLP-dependent enzyme [Alicyclobacillus tolerans]
MDFREHPLHEHGWQEHRLNFPILSRKIHLANCSMGPKSIPVQNAIQEYLDSWGSKGMDWDFWMSEVARAKQSFAKLIHAHPEEIAVLSSVSETVSTIASALPAVLSKNQVLVGTEEFPTVGHAWLGSARKGRLDVRFVEPHGYFFTPSTFEPHLADSTAILSIHLASYKSGAKQDVAELAKLAHAHNAWIFVDAYQAAGSVEIDVQQMDVDFLASGTLKYLLGTPGIAFLYVKKEVAEQLEPAMTGWFGRVDPFAFDTTHLDFAPGSGRFNMGTPPILPAFAARAGIDYVQSVGTRVIEARIQALSRHCLEQAVQRGLEVASPADWRKKGAMTAIRANHPHELEGFLAERNILCSARGDVIRIAPHFFSEESEIDAALDAILDWEHSCKKP